MSQPQPPPPGQAQIPLVSSTPPPGPPGQVMTTLNAQPPPPGVTSRSGDFQQNFEMTPPPQLRAATPMIHPLVSGKESLVPTKLPTTPAVVTTPTNNIQKKQPQPKKSTQPLHLLVQECCKEYITGFLKTKSEEDTKELFNDRRKLHADLQLYCTDDVLTSARDRILNELDERGKEALKDINPDSEIIKLRFQEAAALNKSFSDAIEELKSTYVNTDQASVEGSWNEENENANNNNTEVFGQIFRLWEQYNKTDTSEVTNAGHSEQNRNRGRGNNRGAYWPARGGPRHSPYQNQGAQRRRDWIAREDREYRDRRPDGHYRDRREDYARRDFDRKPDFRGPSAPSPAFNRERLQMGRRDDPYHRNYDDRRKNSHERRPEDNRHRDHRGPLIPLSVGPPPKSSPAIYEAPPMPPMPPNIPNPQIQSSQPGYDYTQYSTDSQYSSVIGFQTEYYNSQVYPGYFAPYSQEPSANGQQNQQYQYTGISNWDTTSSMQSLSIQLSSFNWNQPGRHTAIPLPTDFMSGPSTAPRLSMPEPHDVLGVIKGVIIRDAQGNIGLSQYQFSTM
ncbi:17272_t:CDS:2 [Acaulospora morrowiae]|uniref:17272_t:CDS:1 n=1 Tax=Acaulospora morrowiae TaxID=94023 RepID=A0A9N9AG35_9GLOM|nr:17272_t:CDS:2 [Acaulospora morrowiae]